MKKLLEISELSKKYSEQKGIFSISFSLAPGEVLGLIGPNGSGKTTTLKSILGLLKSDSGHVEIFGKSIDKSFSSIMQFVGYLPSTLSAYENMTGKRFLQYAASFYEIDYSENIFALAKRFDLDLTEKIKEMSFGNKRKVALINALFHSPKLILLDEPTNGLDPTTSLELMKLLEEEREKGCGILFSSNNLSDVQKICTHILVIRDGSIVSTLDRSDLKQSHKRVFIESEKKLDVKNLNLTGIRDLKIQERKAGFLFAGNISELIKRLNSLDLVNLVIDEPSIDELLLHFYQ